jgi:hypothetical protein
MLEVSDYLRTEYAGSELHEVLSQPTHVLLGVNPAAANALKEIGIETVFDLGSSWLFANARVAAEAGQLSTTAGRFGRAPSDWLKPTASFESLDDIATLPLENLRSLTDADAITLKTALDVTTIRDFAFWPPRQVAHKFVSDAVGTAIDPEEQQSEELRPRFGEYPTERVYYNTLAMLQMDEDAKRSPLQGPISLMPAVNEPMGFGKVAVGALLTYSQSWYAKGVTLGHMLHSLALAPGEATRIAVIDWSRRTSATATEAITETEQLDNATQHSRAISEVQNAVASELQRGGSMTSGWAKSHSESTADTASSGVIESLFDSGSTSSTSQDASTETFAQSASWSIGKRSISASMTQNINDRTEQHSNSVRNRRATAVREVSQSEHEEVSTRIVANYNHMHALTVQYYEVVQVYQVASQLHQAERCLFVPFELLDFSAPNAMDIIERFRGAFVRGALTARVRDLLIDDTTMVAIKPIVKVRVPRPEITGRLTAVALRMAPANPNPAAEEPAAGDESNTAAAARAMQIWNRDQVLRVSRVLGRSSIRPGSDALYLTDDTELLGLSFSGVNVSSVRLERPGVSAAENTFTVPTNSAHVDLPPGIRLPELDAIFLAKANNPADTGSMTLHCVFRGREFSTPSIPIELGTGTAMQKVVSLETDEVNRRRELIAHLQANRAHYSQAVFQSLDSATLVMLLSPFTWNGKSLVDQVEPTPLAVTGNFLVLRAPIEPDEPSGVVENGSNLIWGAVLKQRGIDFTISNARLVPVPTGGVFAEAVLGRSNSAEKLDITRFWNWQDSPIPLQPTEISPVGTGTRGTPEDLKPGSLSSPVLNIVNPTSLPDPAGLSASLGVLASANLFRDMSGLQGTQALSEAAMRETLAAASQAGQLASTNLQTEAQKAVAMGQIAADIAKAAMGIPSTSSTDGISAEGARINHGRDMDERGVSGPGGTSPEGGGSGGGSGGGGTSGSNGDASNGGSSGSGGGFSREGAYADRGAFGFSPDAVDAATGGVADLIKSGVLQEASAKKVSAPDSWGGFGEELEYFLSGTNPDATAQVIPLLRKSKTFERKARIIGAKYKSAFKNRYETVYLNIDENYRGKRFLEISGGDGGSFQADEYLFTDSITLTAVYSAETPRINVPEIAHEVSHALNYLSGLPQPQTLSDAITAGVGEEINVRKDEKKILDEIRKADRSAPDFGPGGTTDPGKVEREVSPGVNLTYLESAVLHFWLAEARKSAQLTDKQVLEIQSEGKISFPTWPTSQLEYAKIYFKMLKAQDEWEKFHEQTPRADNDYERKRDVLSNTHVETILDLQVMYRT